MTPRQLQVLRLVANGMTYKEVSESLYISPETVHRHVRGAYERLGVQTGTAHNSRLEAFRKLGWLKVS